MGKRAKPLHQQVELLRKRGMIVDDEAKAQNIILEIGWYRLSLYWFPFEKRYPDMMAENHHFIDGVRFEDALMLYAFDFNMRNMLMRMLERIETAFRTFVIYHVSMRHPESPYWFVDTNIVSTDQARGFDRAIYTPLRKINQDIILHHRRFPRDRYAPAWKTLEFMTFGAMEALYSSLRSDQVKREISSHFGVDSPDVFESYLDALKALRNTCAHGNVLYAFSTPSEIRRGPALTRHDKPKSLAATLDVLHYLLNRLSPRAAKELGNETDRMIREFATTEHVACVLRTIAGLHVDLPNNRKHGRSNRGCRG